ncbi:MAG: hypothetical protein D3922_12460 [Candidatus Electrothrix sp. AR1]|nr:hypothetical protein [Candidatus Electrothrix sp. AR1]
MSRNIGIASSTNKKRIFEYSLIIAIIIGEEDVFVNKKYMHLDRTSANIQCFKADLFIVFCFISVMIIGYRLNEFDLLLCK